jgi:hypothetical protein
MNGVIPDVGGVPVRATGKPLASGIYTNFINNTISYSKQKAVE